MSSLDDAGLKWLKGDKDGAIEGMKAWAGEPGDDSAPLSERIMHAQLSGDLPGAATLALEWIESEPDDVMAHLSLAETLHIGGLRSEALEVLQAAQQVDGDHPMYHRLVFLCATAAGAYSAAHGAAFYAALSGLPQPILNDLRRRAVYRSPEGEAGAYPKEENTDPLWQQLLPSLLRPDAPPVHLAWDEVDGQAWIYNRDLLDAAVAASQSAEGIAWSQFPQAAAIVEERVQFLAGRAADECAIEPWMCASWQGIPLLAALEQYGFHPVRRRASAALAAERIATKLPGGVIETGMAHGPGGRGTEAWTRSDSVASVELVARLLQPATNGRITLTGPDRRISQAFAWLTSGLPKRVRRARLHT